jgi:uncharacterized protein YjiK
MINPHVPPAGIAPLDEPLRAIEQRIRDSGRFPIGFDGPAKDARERSRAIAREFYPPKLFEVARRRPAHSSAATAHSDRRDGGVLSRR